MPTFEFNTVTRIVFGRGQISRLGEIVRPFGGPVLVVYNAGTLGGGGAVDRVAEQLSAAGMHCTFVQQRGEPQVSDIDRAMEAARQAGCRSVVGVGGGSAIDAAKAVAGLLTNGGTVLDYMEVVGKGQKITQPAAPWVAVPTTAGTGAEATRNAVIGFPEKRFKASLRSELLLPRVAVIDPQLGVGVPPEVTAASGMDALCQLVESYTSTGAEPITDGLALRGIMLATRSLRRAFAHGDDLEALEDMALAALLSGITLANAGLGAVHGFAAPLGANFPVPHGTVCAALLPHVIAANVAALRAQSAEHPVLARYAEIGRIFAGDPALAAEAAIDRCVTFTAELAADLKIPALGRYGLASKDVPEMVALARKASSMRFNPVVLPDEVLAEVLRRAL